MAAAGVSASALLSDVSCLVFLLALFSFQTALDITTRCVSLPHCPIRQCSLTTGTWQRKRSEWLWLEQAVSSRCRPGLRHQAPAGTILDVLGAVCAWGAHTVLPAIGWWAVGGGGLSVLSGCHLGASPRGGGDGCEAGG